MMGYAITAVENNWVFIHHDLRDELDGFIMLVKSIASEVDGRILQLDGEDIQYTVQNDPYNLVFRWDSKYGIVVVVPDVGIMDDVVTMLGTHIEKLNG